MRRYAGLYTSATRRFLGLKTKVQVQRTAEKTTPRWASMIARIFGTLPIQCPRCQKEMKLAGFITRLSEISPLIPELSRAPPHKKLESFADLHGKIPFLVAAEDSTTYEPENLSQLPSESEQDFDQRIQE